MNPLPVKDIATSISKVREMEKLGFRSEEYTSFDLAFHLVKVYRVWKELEEKIKSIKIVLLDKQVDKMMFWDDELSVSVGNKNSTSQIHMKKLYEEAKAAGVEAEFWRASTAVESNIENEVLLGLFRKNKEVFPGAKNAELKIAKITKDEKLANV